MFSQFLNNLKRSDIMTKTIDKMRMLIWFIIGMALYLASWFAGTDNPFIQTILYKTGHVTTLAWLGYWISRNAIGRIDRARSTEGQYLARAVVIAGVIIAGSLGL